jgi:hypothetical protein
MLNETIEHMKIFFRILTILFGTYVIFCAARGLMIGKIIIGSKFGHGSEIVLRTDRPEKFWIYVVIFLIAGVILIWQGLRNKS